MGDVVVLCFLLNMIDGMDRWNGLMLLYVIMVMMVGMDGVGDVVVSMVDFGKVMV